MGTPKIRDLVHEYINQADERFVSLVYGMIQADKSSDLLLSEPEFEELEKRVTRHKKGDSKSYSWNEVKSQLKS